MSKIVEYIKKIFKRKELSDLEKELKKYPRSRRERLRELYNQWENGNVVKIEQINKKLNKNG